MNRLIARLGPIRAAGLALLGLFLMLLAIWFVFFSGPRERVYSLTLSTGQLIRPPKRITTFFEKHGEDHGIHFKLVHSDGSEDSLAKIDRGELDLAVIKGGLNLGQLQNVRQVATLDMEAFYLLVQKPIFDQWKHDWEKDYLLLKGRKININKPTTGTHQWSLDILRFAGLTPITPAGKGNFIPDTLGNPELLRALDAVETAAEPERGQLIAALPDAVVLAELMPSPMVQRLVRGADYRLVPLDFGAAYIQHLHAQPPGVLDPTVTIEAVTVPAYAYGVGPHAVPRQPCATIGVRRLLVADKKVPAEAVVRCLRMLYDETSPTTPLDFQDWAKFRPQYPVHEGVPIYDDERKKVLQHTIIRFVEKLASVLGGIIGGILAIYGYFRWRRLLRFEHYFYEIRRIELIARGSEIDAAAPTGRPQLLAYLRNRLSDLRSAAIVEFARGRLQGENLILSIFTLIKDTSDEIATLLG